MDDKPTGGGYKCFNRLMDLAWGTPKDKGTGYVPQSCIGSNSVSSMTETRSSLSQKKQVVVKRERP